MNHRLIKTGIIHKFGEPKTAAGCGARAKEGEVWWSHCGNMKLSDRFEETTDPITCKVCARVQRSIEISAKSRLERKNPFESEVERA